MQRLILITNRNRNFSQMLKKKPLFSLSVRICRQNSIQHYKERKKTVNGLGLMGFLVNLLGLNLRGPLDGPLHSSESVRRAVEEEESAQTAKSFFNRSRRTTVSATAASTFAVKQIIEVNNFQFL